MRGNGKSIRDFIYINDIVDLYKLLSKNLYKKPKKYSGEIFNAGYHNHSVSELGNIVKSKIGDDVILDTIQSNDNRSYHISSKKIKIKLGFNTTKNIGDAVLDLKKAFEQNLLPNSLDNEKYFNIKKMNNIKLR